jgi:hypothetical protein
VRFNAPPEVTVVELNSEQIASHPYSVVAELAPTTANLVRSAAPAFAAASQKGALPRRTI